MLRESGAKVTLPGGNSFQPVRTVLLCDVDTGVSYVELYESTKVVVILVVLVVVVVVVRLVVIAVLVVVIGGGGVGRGGEYIVSLTLSLSTTS
jgi:hypothetical protein